MTGIKRFLPTEGANAGKLFDEDGVEILITNADGREAIAGGVVPVDIGTRPNANDGDPLRTSFSKLNNFVLASYQNDSDVQERVGSLEAGAVFLGMYRQDTIPRRETPFRTPLPWTAGDAWPEGSVDAVPYFERDPEAVPDLNARPEATPVYAMLSQSIVGRPNLSVVIDNITATSFTGDLTITIILPSEITDFALPTSSLPAPGIAAVNAGGMLFRFNTISGTIRLGDPDTRTAEGIAEAIRDALNTAQGGIDYFTFNIEAPTDDTRRLTVDYNFKAATDAAVLIPNTLFQSTGAGDVETYRNTLVSISSGNTTRSGILALPWFDQNISLDIIPAYSMLIWTINGWTIAADGFGAISSKFLAFDDERAIADIANVDLDLNNSDATRLIATATNNRLREITSTETRDAITEVQQFGINYIHSVTIDAGEF